jgi:hypothetical protein
MLQRPIAGPKTASLSSHFKQRMPPETNRGGDA